MDFRDTLAKYFVAQAERREQEAEKYAEDDRHSKSADGLRTLADYVRTLPEGDRRLTTLQTLDLNAHTEYLQPGAEGYRVASGYRFDRPDETPDAFLTAFTDACVSDAAEDNSGDSAPWRD